MELLGQVRDFYLSIKENQRGQPEIYQPAGEWREHVNQRMPHYAAYQDRSIDRLADMLRNFW